MKLEIKVFDHSREYTEIDVSQEFKAIIYRNKISGKDFLKLQVHMSSKDIMSFESVSELDKFIDQMIGVRSKLAKRNPLNEELTKLGFYIKCLRTLWPKKRS